MNQNSFISTHITGLLANRYQLKQLIGSGGMGEVFLADDILLGGTPVAVKFLAQTFFTSKMQQDFAREAMLSAALSQKSLHIVRAYDYGVSAEGKPFYVMEYLNGKSLKDLLPMPLPKFLILARQICLGLQCAHQGINIDGKTYPLVHRDIKPANILVIPDPILGELIKILDFGIAKFINYANTASTSRGFNGTLPYCSPEQLEGGEIDSRSDIYSLGVMMFEMLTGAKPWQPETDLFGAWYKAHHFEAPRTIATVSPQLKIPQQLNSLIMACLEKKPSDRPQNVAEILQVLGCLEKSSCQSLPKPLASKYNPQFPVGAELSPLLKANFANLTWPQNKPIQEIVFPHLLNTPQGTLGTLWLMLPKQEIKKRVLCQRYNQFIFITSPHPMLLWVTLLYDQEIGPKWLPCYLDMQNPQNQQVVYSLAEHGRYPLICFTLEAPHSCINVLSSHIVNTQRQRLKLWVEQSKTLPPANQALLSKNLLKQQYKQMQSRILQHLAAKPQVFATSST
ncbi:serine/threonine protein kinase [Nostoc sp. FACHB-152]|uniref:serine/threonine protein kinase n=1 Tax=unclassified Nostoc TaxID=2593658 RepID=UPI001683C388|nr:MULTISPECIES: protein kinase [unclassified Nostoc]MBD2446123.1 serine/threonine protein kinase [Nostoc sp. FACHB-152]MBD2467355.1 serine/threonine protein kinase [Nostoc sp. FACHB-145]